MSAPSRLYYVVKRFQATKTTVFEFALVTHTALGFVAVRTHHNIATFAHDAARYLCRNSELAPDISFEVPCRLSFTAEWAAFRFEPLERDNQDLLIGCLVAEVKKARL